jgi:hypothetical protein
MNISFFDFFGGGASGAAAPGLPGGDLAGAADTDRSILERAMPIMVQIACRHCNGNLDAVTPHPPAAAPGGRKTAPGLPRDQA